MADGVGITYTSINDAGDRHEWEHAGEGVVEDHGDGDLFLSHANLGEDLPFAFDPDEDFDRKKEQSEKHKLGQFRATSIAGNDITSSCLYVVGLAVVTAGKMAPISLLLVVILLYLFRNVYSEVGSALPLNGGAYNALLNTTSKVVAALAACLTILSYVATAVVSASEACEYASDVIDGLPVFWCTFIVLAFFAFLNLIGITESSAVALVIFVFHLLTLAILIVACTIYLIKDPSVLQTNWQEMGPVSDVNSYLVDIFLGFSAALLGVSGFESSANYIEEQKEGVFPKTLRNMWAIVAVINPVMALLALSVVNHNDFLDEETNLLADMGAIAGGDWLGTLVSVDAFFVLSGAVLTAYVGVVGLVKRMSLDRCLPSVFLAENSLRHTNHWIIISFLLITCSLYTIVRGDVTTLSGMYSVAFLGVMALFAAGNMMLKYKRDSIPRAVRAHWPVVLLAIVGVLAGLVGNVIISPVILIYFSIYFAITFLLVMMMFSRVFLFKLLLYFVNRSFLSSALGPALEGYTQTFKNQKMVFFAKKADPAVLNKAVLYIKENEQTNNISIIHFYPIGENPPPDMKEYVRMLDLMYPKLRIDLDFFEGNFSPAYVRKVSKRLDVPSNFMFMTCIDEKYKSTIHDFGGVRFITH